MGWSLAEVVAADVERLKAEQRDAIEEIIGFTLLTLRMKFGSSSEDRTSRCDDPLVDGFPAPELEGWRFWAPRGIGHLEVWARSASDRHDIDQWYDVERPADLATLIPGDSPRSGSGHPLPQIMQGFKAPSSD